MYTPIHSVTLSVMKMSTNIYYYYIKYDTVLMPQLNKYEFLWIKPMKTAKRSYPHYNFVWIVWQNM